MKHIGDVQKSSGKFSGARTHRVFSSVAGATPLGPAAVVALQLSLSASVAFCGGPASALPSAVPFPGAEVAAVPAPSLTALAGAAASSSAERL